MKNEFSTLMDKFQAISTLMEKRKCGLTVRQLSGVQAPLHYHLHSGLFCFLHPHYCGSERGKQLNGHRAAAAEHQNNYSRFMFSFVSPFVCYYCCRTVHSAFAQCSVLLAAK